MPRVLIVDNDLDGMAAVCRFLEKAGHDVVCRHNGREALAALASVSPDIVILDMVMPEMDGVEFLEVLRNYYRGARLPVIVLTAIPEGSHVRRALKLGVRDVFPKADFLLSDLAARVNALAHQVHGAAVPPNAPAADLPA